MNEYFLNLKNKYNYDDQLINIISGVISAFVEVLGEQYKDRLLDAFNNIPIFTYKEPREAGEMLTRYFNNGKKYRISSMAKGGAFVEDEYSIDQNGELVQHFIIGLGSYDDKAIQSLIHEMLHALSYHKPILEDGIIKTGTGFNTFSYNFDGNSKGTVMDEKNLVFNELITENIAMQVMDAYDKNKVHEPAAYNAVVEEFNGIFRCDAVNPIIIDDYFNNTYNFLEVVPTILAQEKYQDIISGLYQYCDNNPVYINHLDYLRGLSVRDFVAYYIERTNQIFSTDRNSDEYFKIRLDRELALEISSELKKSKQYE